MRGRGVATAHAGLRAASPSVPGIRKPDRPTLRLIDAQASGQRQAGRQGLLLRIGLVISAFMVFAAVASHVVLVQSQFKLESNERAAKEEEVRYERLRLEVARLASPERIVAEAAGRLAMTIPIEVEYLDAPDVSGAAPLPPVEQPVAGEAGDGWSEVKPHLAARF